MEINEIWLPIKGFEGKYEVSNRGRVKSIGGKFKLSPESYIAHSQRFIAERFDVTRRQISDIIAGVCWPHLPILDYSGSRTFRHEYPRANPKFSAEQMQDMLSYHGKLPYNEIAAKCGCSPAFLSQLFNGRVKGVPNYSAEPM